MDAYLQRLQEGIASATHGLSPEDLRRHPESKWSTAEVLEHLYLTYTGTTKAFERCLQEGKPLARKPMLLDRIRTFVVTGLGHMPEGRKAPERAQPRGMPADEVSREIGSRNLSYGHSNRTMRSSLRRANENPGSSDPRALDRPPVA